SSFLALFKDDLITLFLGKVVGFEGLGYIGWAKKWAEAPIRIIMDNISRVLFPVLSRLQHQKDKVSKIIEKFLYYQTLLLTPSIVGLALIMKSIVDVIPGYNKWEPALPLFYLFVIAAFFSSYSTPFMNLFNALGKVKVSFSFMFFWTAATWLLTLILTDRFGLYGFPLTQFFLSLTFIFVVFKARQLVSFNFLQPILPSLLAGLLMAILTYSLLGLFSTSFVGLTSVILISGAFYFIMLRFLFRIDVIQEVKSLFQ
ncbi:oligosaccharide flippase family protein, partial [Candidatus Roizmanbacteria bacterium]|nr:oligosaccharide flippase family protein [Candidatus Roizmanbacteria bacterium]